MVTERNIIYTEEESPPPTTVDDQEESERAFYVQVREVYLANKDFLMKDAQGKLPSELNDRDITKLQRAIFRTQEWRYIQHVRDKASVDRGGEEVNH